MRRHLWGQAVTLKHINKSGTWPSGNPRLYYRPKGEKAVALPDMPMDAPAFLAAYAAAAGLSSLPEPPAQTGTIAAAIVAFMRSDEWHSKAQTTRAVWRRGLDDIRGRYGKAPIAKLEARHIRVDLARLAPNPARQRFKIWRALLGWCHRVGMIETDATRDVAKPKAPEGKGHTPWAREDVAKFRAAWPVGTAQRLAFEALYWTGARVSDLVKIGDAHMKDGVLRFVQRKTGDPVAIPLDDAPAYAEPDGLLLDCLRARKSRGLVWLTTEQGAARSEKAASQWFSAAARKAGLTDRTAHGLRHARATIMKENGATVEQRRAWLGHDSEAMAAKYSKTADLLRVIMGADAEQKVTTLKTSSNPKGASA